MIGESAGRSPQHRQRGTARRRFSESERAQNTPLPDDTQEWPDEEPRRSFVREIIQDIVTALVVVILVGVGLTMAYARSPIWQGVGIMLVSVVAVSGWFAVLNVRRTAR